VTFTKTLAFSPVQASVPALGGLEMAWTAPKYNRGRVDAAGDSLLLESLEHAEHDGALAVVNNWRMADHYPLQIIKMNLLKWSNRVDREALVISGSNGSLPLSQSFDATLI
jgi:hypothetical protein